MGVFLFVYLSKYGTHVSIEQRKGEREEVKKGEREKERDRELLRDHIIYRATVQKQ